MYDLVNIDGQTGSDSATEIASGGVSIPHTGQSLLDANNIIKDDILDNTDLDYTVPMQKNGIVLIGSTLSTYSAVLGGPMAITTDGTCTNSEGEIKTIQVNPTTGGWYPKYSNCEISHYKISPTTTDLESDDYFMMYNDAAIWQNGTTPYILDMKIQYIGAYANNGTVNAYNSSYTSAVEMRLSKPEITANGGQISFEISFTISDSPEYGYADAGKTPEEIAGHDVPVNLIFKDMETASTISIDKDELYGAIIPYCDVKYNTDLTIDTANTDPECLTTHTTGVSPGDSDGFENDFGYDITDSEQRYHYTWKRRGYTYSYTDSDGHQIWEPTEPDALLPQYIMDQRLKVVESDSGQYIGIMDSWRNGGNSNNQTNTNYQISTNDSHFKIYHTLQHQWFYDMAYSYDYAGGHTIGIASTEEPIVSMAKVQEDAGIDGKGVNDDVVAPGETVHYRLYAINSGFDGEAGYRFYDDVTNLLEYTGVVSNIGVKKVTGTNFSPFLAEYTQYMNDPTLGDIPACGSAEATYTCEDVTAITNSSAGAVVDVTLNEELPTQTAYELSFDVVVGTDYNGQTDKTITNTGYLTEPGCIITSGVPSSTCSANESVTIEYGSIALKIVKGVNDTVDSTYTPSEGISANGDTYASSEEWLNYTLTITNASADGALNVAQDVKIVDDLTLGTNLSKIDPATIVVTSSIDGALVAPADYTDASDITKLDITLPAIEVDETITITFKAQTS